MDRLNETKVEINSHYCCDPAMGDTILRTPGINVSVKKNACVSVMPHFEEDILALTTESSSDSYQTSFTLAADSAVNLQHGHERSHHTWNVLLHYLV